MHQDPAATATYIQASQLRWTQGLGHAGVPNGIGLGWVHINQPDDPTMIIEKTGGGAGYTTYIALNPGRHIGLFVAATEGRHAAADIFRASNDLLTYLAGLTPVPLDSTELAAEANRSTAQNHSAPQVREASLHKRHRNVEGPRPTRQLARTTLVAAGQ